MSTSTLPNPTHNPPCEDCQMPRTFRRWRQFKRGAAAVWICTNEKCRSFNLYSYEADGRAMFDPELVFDRAVIDRNVHRLINSTKRVGLVCQMSPPRIGCLAFLTYLEYEQFPPRHPANLNDLFFLTIVNFQEVQYALVIIPRNNLEAADALAKRLGLRRADGVPTVISIDRKNGTKSVQHFPYQNRNIYTMENVSGHFMYQNNAELAHQALRQEVDTVHKFLAKWDEEHPLPNERQ